MGWLDNLVNSPSTGQILGEEAIGIPLTLAGLLGTAAGIPLAAPELALGGALTGLGYQGIQHNRQQELDHEAGSFMAPYLEDPASLQKDRGKIIGKLSDFYGPDKALAMYSGALKATAIPKEAMPRQVISNGQLITFPTAAGAQATASPIVGYQAPTKEPGSGFALWHIQNPHGTYAQFENERQQIDARYRVPPRPPKSPAQIAADAAARTTGTFTALSGMPIARWNPGVVALSNDKTLRLVPGATEADVESGKVVPVLKGDMKQLRQAQTAYVALDNLEGTIDSALPKNPGALSASGMLGRHVTEVINPSKLARFNAARFGASDAFVRALTQRGNKAQFDAAMANIVGPNATVESARAGIQEAKQIIDDLKNSLTSQAATGLSGSERSVVGTLGGAPPPEPPPGGFE